MKDLRYQESFSLLNLKQLCELDKEITIGSQQSKSVLQWDVVDFSDITSEREGRI